MILVSLTYNETGVGSAGTLTGLLLFIPLSAVLLWSSAGRLSRPAFVASVLFGILVHALATVSALG